MSLSFQNEYDIQGPESPKPSSKEGAAIHLNANGSQLFASDRGHSNIAVFSINSKGNLSFQKTINSGGQTPRDFNVDPTGHR